MSIKQFVRDTLARGIAPILRRLVFDPRYFHIWQAYGVHVLPVHYYHPIPDTRDLPADIWERKSELPGIQISDEAQLKLLEGFASKYGGEYRALSQQPAEGTQRFDFGNSSFGSVDAEMLYCMVRHFKPRRVIEIGSGFSTLLIVDALAANLKEGWPGHLTSIEPYPRDFLRNALPDFAELVVQPVQQVPLHEFTSLTANDILFIDSSHVCKIGSDVQYELLEILPRLGQGVAVHFHDIFLPREYPRKWVLNEHRFWNEQYLLQAFLCGNESFEVLWTGGYMQLKYPERLAAAFESYRQSDTWPGSFWIRRVK